MAAPAKFMFNADFAPGAANPAERPIPRAEHAALLAQAETEAYRKGFAAAEAEVAAEARRRQTAALERIAAANEALRQTLAAIEARLESETVEVAVAVGRKLAGELIIREPVAEIATLASDCFKQLVKTPHVVVRVNPGQHEMAQSQISEIAKQRGFEGRLVVMSDPEIAGADCRIEWADGGVTRDRAAVDALITEAVSRYLTARLAQTK